MKGAIVDNHWRPIDNVYNDRSNISIICISNSSIRLHMCCSYIGVLIKGDTITLYTR